MPMQPAFFAGIEVSGILAGKGSEPRMAEATDTYRMAIASLEVPLPLQTVVTELGHHRIPADCLSLAGAAGTIATLREIVAKQDAIALAPLLEVAPFPFGTPTEIYMTARSWQSEVKDPSRRPQVQGDEVIGSGGCWLTPQFRQNLLDRMLKGDVMLLAGPLTAEQLNIGTRVLLRHSNHHVQSHTFVRPRMA